MAFLSTRTKTTSHSTKCMDETKLNEMVSLIEPYKEAEEVTDESLKRPFDQVKSNFVKLYQILYDRGINV